MADNRAARLQGGQRDDPHEDMEDETEENDSGQQEVDSTRAEDVGETGGPSFWEKIVFDCPTRMILSDRERNVALSIKAAIAANPDVDPVSDFMCAQLALIEGDNLEGAMARAHHLQCLREEYGILDTAEDGRRCFAEYIKLFPRLHLSFTFHNEGGNYVMIHDNAQFDPNRLKSEEQIRSFLGGNYYSCTVFCPDFESIRTGGVFVAECQGYVRQCRVQKAE
jgi:hypothetical protein